MSKKWTVIKKKIPFSNFTSAEIIENLRQGRFGFLEVLDDQYRSRFLAWASRRFVAIPNDLEDAWQEALVVFYEKVMSGKLTSLGCSAQTWLFATGGNHLLNQNRKMRRMVFLDDSDRAMLGKIEIGLPENDREDEKEMLQNALQLLSEKCRNLLVLRHFDGYSVPEIREMSGYKHENVVSVQLSKCLSNLKEIIREKLLNDGRK